MSDSILAELFAPEAEQSVLGCILQDNQAYDRAILNPADFHDEYLRDVYIAMRELITKGQPADPVTLTNNLGGTGEMAAEFFHWQQSSASAVNITTYARIVRERAINRRLHGAGEQIRDLALTHMDIADKQGRANQLIEQALGQHQTSTILTAHDLVSASVENLEKRIEAGGGITGVPTGLTDLDEMLGGLQPSDLIILAARPSMGKTALGMNFVEHVIFNVGAAAVFSLEMPGSGLMDRMICGYARIDSQRFRAGRLTDLEWDAFHKAASELMDKPLFVDETGSITISELRARARLLDRKHGPLKLIVVDYLQLMGIENPSGNRATDIGQLSAGLKACAKELKVPVVALSQLNRSLETRPDKRPLMSDLRESGNVEQDADVILAVYRDVVYNPDTPHPGKTELLIRKQRNGPVGAVKATFLNKYTRFVNYAAEDAEQARPGHDTDINF